MDSSKLKYTVTYGGWYQRTTLHLSEIYDFLALKRAKSEFSAKVIKANHEKLQISKVTREAGHLEFVKVVTNNGIEIRYYEDGLYVLEINTNEIENGRKILETYFLVDNYYFVQAGLAYPTNLNALAGAQDSIFTLTTAGFVGFSIRDNPLSDNQGGISLNINSVPVPGAVWLFVSGLAGLVGLRRKVKK